MASLKRVLQNSSLRAMKTLSLKNLCIQNLQACHNCNKRTLASSFPTTASVPNQSPKSQVRHYSSERDKAAAAKVLSHSSIFVQDGIDIEELPILIRRATRDSFPFTSHTYTGERIQEESDFDISFRRVLQNCNSVNDVFKLLEVPSDVVRGYSAAFALQRLHVLKEMNSDWQQIHSFIRSAVMRELYDTVQKDVHLLSNPTLLSLVECYIAAEGFSSSCLDAINIELQCRLADGSMSVEELLTLAGLLKASMTMSNWNPPFPLNSAFQSSATASTDSSQFLSNNDRFWAEGKDVQESKTVHFDKFSAKSSPEMREEIRAKCQELLNTVWIHLTSRYRDVDAHTLPITLGALTSDRKNIVTLLEKPMSEVWTDLSQEGVAQCLDSLVKLRVYSTSMMTSLGQWAYVNIHLMTPSLMLAFLNTFTLFDFSDKNLIKVMERCLQLKGQTVETSVIAMSMEYLRCCRYVSPVVMAVAADHFIQHADSYQPLQLYAVLRVYGQLNFLPSRSTEFLKKVESCLWNRFDHLEEVHLLEILGSFTFVDVLPKNFVHRLTSQSFYTKVGALKKSRKRPALVWLKLLKHALNLDDASDLNKNMDWILKRRSRWSVFCYEDSHKFATSTLRWVLDEIVGRYCYHILPFYECCAIYMDENGKPISVMKSPEGPYVLTEQPHKKVALLVRSADHFTVNTRQLLGAQAQRKKHLEKLGYVPIEMRATDLLRPRKSIKVVREYLSPYLDMEATSKSRKEAGKTEMVPEENDIVQCDWPGHEDTELYGDDEFSFDEETTDAELKNIFVTPEVNKEEGDANGILDKKNNSGLLFDHSDFDEDDP